MNENDLIKQKDTEIYILIRKNARLKDEVSELRAEVERLKNAYKQCAWERDVFAEDTREELAKHITICEAEKTEIKTEARKEFAERLKCGVPRETGVIRCADIDNLLAEMESERE